METPDTPTGSGAGRPSIVTPELLEKAEKYVVGEVWRESGNVVPTVEGLADYLDISRDTLYDREEFSDTLEKLRKKQADSLINNGLSGKFNGAIVKLLLNSKYGYVERSANDITTNGANINIPADPNAVAAYNEYLKNQK